MKLYLALATFMVGFATAARGADLPLCTTSTVRNSTPLTTEQGQLPMSPDQTVDAGQAMLYHGPVGRYLAFVNLPRGARYDGASLKSSDDRVDVPAGRYAVSGAYRNDISFAVPGILPESAERVAYPTGFVRLVLLKNSGRLYLFWQRRPDTVDWKAGVRAEDFTVDYCVGPASGGFRSELVYLGVTQNLIKVSYREYAGRGERATAVQDLEFDLTEGRTIAVKGARLEILDATNSGITYRVLSPLE